MHEDDAKMSGEYTVRVSATDAIVSCIQQAATLYNRLLLVVGPSGAGKSDALATVREHTAAQVVPVVPVVNVGLELARRLLEFAVRERPLQVQPLFEQLLASSGDVVLLDHTELLFDASLQQDPLRLLQSVSRNRTVVAAWTGVVDAGTLCYAVPGHPEHRRYAAEGLLIVTV